MLARWVLVVDYGVSVIVAKEGDSAKQGDGTEVMSRDSLRFISKQDLTTEIKIRKRIPSFKVLNQVDAPLAFTGAAQEQGLLALGRLCGQHERMCGKRRGSRR